MIQVSFFCYGSDDNSKGVIGLVYDKVVRKVYEDMDGFRRLSQCSYAKDGKIKDCRCLSEIDWKHFEDLWPGAVVDVEA